MRWNGDPDNDEEVKIYKNKSMCCSKISYLCCHKSEKSKLEKYAYLLELYNELEFQIIKSAKGSIVSEKALDDDNLEIQITNTSNYDLQRETLDEFVLKFKELTNLNILKNEYGIDIPDNDLVITVDST